MSIVRKGDFWTIYKIQGKENKLKTLLSVYNSGTVGTTTFDWLLSGNIFLETAFMDHKVSSFCSLDKTSQVLDSNLIYDIFLGTVCIYQNVSSICSLDKPSQVLDSNLIYILSENAV